MFWAYISILIRSGLILAAADLLRRSSKKVGAAGRHRIVVAAFILLLTWPLLSALLPAIEVPLPVRPVARVSVTVEQTAYFLRGGVPASAEIPWPIVIWLAGVVLALLPLIGGHLRLCAVLRKATALSDETWHELLTEECARLSIRRRPALQVHARPVMPFTCGLWRSRIVLPPDCLNWTPVRRRTVLAHELAHIARHDLLWHFFAALVTALWWFQPLCWWNRTILRRESERACDALVLASGVRPSDYAGELLEIARSFPAGLRWASASIAVARRGELESRLYAILDGHSNRAGRSSLFAVAGLAAVTLTASTLAVLPEHSKSSGGHPMRRTLITGLLTSAGLSAATIAGSVFDPSGTAIPNAQASLYNPDTATKQELTTTPEGRFAFENLAPGWYRLSIEKPGFASLYREFNVVQNSDVRRGLTLKVASLRDKQSSNPQDQPPRVAEAHPLNPELLRVPGRFEQEKLITKIQPLYPVSAKSVGLQGTVELEAVISKEGVPEDIRVVSSPGDDLTESALEAVRQWRYSPTLLNGQPVEIITEVIVNYTLLK